MLEFETTISQFEDRRVYNYYIPVLAAQVSDLVSEGNKRVICTLANDYTFHTSLNPRNGDYFILINQQIIKKLQLQLNDTVKVSLIKDNSAYGMPMPDELYENLLQNPEASTHFHLLTPGKQRNLIYIVSQVKSTDSRINKSLAIAEHLIESNGNLDFKGLNVKIKEFNQRGKLKN